MMITEQAAYSEYQESADYLAARIGEVDCAIILGSGLGALCDLMQEPIVIPYGEIPHFPVSTVSYQKGEFVYGVLGGKRILAMNGRFHYYEGWSMGQTAYPIYVLSLLGVKRLIITNAAGGIHEEYAEGALVCVKDHIKLTHDSPARGRNNDSFGPRFFDMQRVYDEELRTLAHRCAKDADIRLFDGVYAYMGGPQYETPAEIRMLRTLGADLVGMSTVPEVIAAAHCGIAVLCISCVTNMAAGITGAVITEEEVLITGQRIAAEFQRLIIDIVTRLD